MGLMHSPNIVRSGLVLYLDAANVKSYPGSGTTWTDLSENGRATSLVNGPTFSSTNNGLISFDGSNDYVSLGTFTGFGSANRSVSCWFKVNLLSARRIINFPADDTGQDIPAYTLSIGNAGAVGTGFGGNPYSSYTTIATLALQTWANVTSTITGNSMSNYYNGILVNTATSNGSVAPNPIGYLGRYNAYWGQYLSGDISNVQVYNRALSAAEVAQNFNALRGRYGL